MLLVNFFEPVRKIGNKRWLTKNDRGSIVGRKNYKHKEGPFYSSFVMVKQYKEEEQKCFRSQLKFYTKYKKYYPKQCPVLEFRHVRLLHNDAPSYTSELAKKFFKSEKVTVLPHPPYSPDLVPCVIKEIILNTFLKPVYFIPFSNKI